MSIRRCLSVTYGQPVALLLCTGASSVALQGVDLVSQVQRCRAPVSTQHRRSIHYANALFRDSDLHREDNGMHRAANGLSDDLL